MKRMLCVVLAVILMVAVLPMGTLAVNEDSKITYFDDGSYMVEEIFVTPMRASGTVSGNKVKTYYGSDDEVRWKATLSGEFTYTGSSATCTASSCSVTIYDSAWYVISKSASKSGNTAYGSGTVGEKLLGVTVQKVNFSLSLTCAKDGNLS